MMELVVPAGAVEPPAPMAVERETGNAITPTATAGTPRDVPRHWSSSAVATPAVASPMMSPVTSPMTAAVVAAACRAATSGQAPESTDGDETTCKGLMPLCH